MYRSSKIQTFQLTSNDPTPKIENVTFHELGLYCSNHCRCNVAATTIQGCYNDLAIVQCKCRVMLVTVLLSQLGHDVMSLVSQARDGTTEATWP
jgi:hypothetical protein